MNTSPQLGGAGNQTITVRNYQIGALGTNYYPSSAASGGLYALIDAGSRTAADAGLAHYTVIPTPTPAKDSGQVDIGYHVIALNGSSLPADADSDGLPDYIEDINGNSSIPPDPGETHWQNVDTDADGLNDGLEAAQWRNPLVREANVFWFVPLK